MRTVASNELKVHFSRFLEETRAGEAFLVTKNGIPVARLLPVSQDDPQATRRAIARIRSERRGKKLGGPVKEFIEEGRR
ncbi:MAG: type II toxin-antitoxin system prevent-host-death family antitoxin [Spirochaetales bacterium]|nr:type II toxin-antitoxin system prevent-host-death family antitoxin [Leptospiraceae bacterium]MCP5483050.1 type II toxin-antitoxin system prevent-host-death family antitoxin [Spirochaetales bacterium]MCP5486143.1 type II toxin-antitoxin system prevent-host-death family antitoxin [Spirochaetales bacterium]